MAKEVMDVLCCAIQIVQYYHLEGELETCVERSYQRMRQEGLIDDAGIA
jgi:hypothetical protein